MFALFQFRVCVYFVWRILVKVCVVYHKMLNYLHNSLFLVLCY